MLITAMLYSVPCRPTCFESAAQAPLQPLQDNLESQTYETFEKDHTKYAMYQQAVYKALLDRVPDSDKETTTTVLMVVGAGEGGVGQCIMLRRQGRP